MTAIRDRLLLLRSLEEFGGMDDEGLLLLVENARERTYRAGEYLTRVDEEARVINVVIEGEVVLKRPKLADSVIKQRRAFGLLTVMADARNQDAIARVDTRVLEIPVRGYSAALEENFSLLRNALRFLGSLLSRLRHRLPADPKRPPKAEIGEYYENPRTLVEQLIELRKGPFVHMNIDALVDLARRMVEVRVPAGHVFWKAGDACTYALHVEYGRIHCTIPSGESVDIASDFTLGVMDLWSGQPRSYDAVAETNIIAYRIDYEDFLVISEMHIQVALDMLRGLARQYLAMDQDDVVLG
jgi:CRP-like cAMP-binding protein